MNRIFHSLWNHALGAWVAAPETARAAAGAGAAARALQPPTPASALRASLQRPGWRPTALALAAAAWGPGMAMASMIDIHVVGDVQSAGTQIGPAPTSPWDLGSASLQIGLQTYGALYISNGASVSAASVGLGYAGIADVEVSGPNSRLRSTGMLYVGSSGTGNLNILDGGSVSSTVTHVGDYGSGHVTVSGVNSSWINSGTLRLGVHGTGELTIDQGGLVKTNELFLGSSGSSTAGGTVWLNGNATDGRGVLEAAQITKVASASDLLINGGILRAAADQSDFLKGFAALNLGMEGAYIDTNGHNIDIASDLGSTTGGGLVKQGEGTLTLTGANTYTGGTTISGGLLVAAAGSLGTGTITNNAALELQQTSNATLNQVLAGTGSLTKSGSGTLTLTGTNTYSGGTTVNAGALSISADSNLGALSGGLTLAQGGTLKTTAGLATNRTILLDAGGGSFDTASGTALSINGVITGTGGLTKNGSGSLQLNAANTYTGDTHVNAGYMALIGAGNLSELTALTVASGATFSIEPASGDRSVGSLAGNGTVVLGNRTLTTGGNNAETTFGGSFTAGENGTGGLHKVGTGTLTLTGSSAYLGTTRISGGTVVAASNLALGRGSTVTVGAAAGATARLQVNTGTTLSQAVELQPNGWLTGSGSVGALSVANQATLAPGDASAPYGTLTVNGNLDFQPGATLQVSAQPNSNTASSVHATGAATLAGSVVHIGPKSNFAVATPYTILTADGGLNGTTFSSASSNYAFLTATLGYTATQVTLTLQGIEDFGSRVNTANQRALVRSVQNLGASSPVYQHLVQAEGSQAAALANSLSGDPHASVGGSLPGLSTYASNLSLQHLRTQTSAGMYPGAAVAQSDGPLPASAWPSSKALPAWAEVVGHWQRYDGDGNAAQLKQRTTGIFVGMDQEVGTSGWRLGGSLGYTNADGKVADRASESDVNSYSAAVYGGKSFGTGTGPRINVLGGLAYTWHDIATTRRISSLGQTLKADYSAHTAQLFAEVGYAMGQYDKVGLEPFVGVSLGQQRTGSFQERGGFAALQGRSSTDDLASTTLGVRVHSDFQLAGKDARVRATVGWRHAFGDVAPSKTMAFEGGQNFTVAGAPLARNTAVLGLEGEVALSRTAALVLGYRGELGSGQRDHSANVKLRWAF